MKIFSEIIKKTICIILLFVCLSSIMISTVNAQAFENGDSFTSNAKKSKFNTLTTDTAKTVVTIVRIVGITIAIVMLLTIAIKYMISSAGDRADIKKHAVAYVVGAFILFGAVGILGAIDEFAQNIEAP